MIMDVKGHKILNNMNNLMLKKINKLKINRLMSVYHKMIIIMKWHKIIKSL